MDHCELCPHKESCLRCEDTYNLTSAGNECVLESYLEFGDWSNMSSFTSNITYYMVATYLGTATGPMVFGEMTNTYFNIELCQFVQFHNAATGGNPEMESFLASLQGISLTNNGSNTPPPARRLLAAASLANPSSFLELNAFIFLLIGLFIVLYAAILIFQRNMDACCNSCPRLFFYVNEICEFMKQRFFWLYLDFIVWLAYIPFLYFAIVQLMNFAFTNFLTGFSSLLSIVIIVVLPLYPFFICYLLKKNYNTLVLENDKLVEMSLRPFIDKVKRPSDVMMIPPDNEENEGCRAKLRRMRRFISFENFRLIVDAIKYFRKFLFVLVIAVSTNPITTISVLIALNVLFIVYLAVFRPRLMPYLVFDFIIEGVLLFFEIFMLVYLVVGGANISVMSIVAHAVGFIMANLSLLIAIILNLIAYYKIFMCLYELYKHLKEKAEEKEKKDLEEDDSEMAVKDKELIGGRKRKNSDDVTEEDISENQMGLMDDKEIFAFNRGSAMDSSLKKSKDGLPHLKQSKSRRNRDDVELRDKELGLSKRRKNSDDVTEEDVDQNERGLMDDKELFAINKGSGIDSSIRRSQGGLPDLKRSRGKARNVLEDF